MDNMGIRLSTLLTFPAMSLRKLVDHQVRLLCDFDSVVLPVDDACAHATLTFSQ
jgi:hypothetical protein